MEDEIRIACPQCGALGEAGSMCEFCGAKIPYPVYEDEDMNDEKFEDSESSQEGRTWEEVLYDPSRYEFPEDEYHNYRSNDDDFCVIRTCEDYREARYYLINKYGRKIIGPYDDINYFSNCGLCLVSQGDVLSESEEHDRQFREQDGLFDPQRNKWIVDLRKFEDSNIFIEGEKVPVRLDEDDDAIDFGFENLLPKSCSVWIDGEEYEYDLENKRWLVKPGQQDRHVYSETKELLYIVLSENNSREGKRTNYLFDLKADKKFLIDLPENFNLTNESWKIESIAEGQLNVDNNSFRLRAVLENDVYKVLDFEVKEKEEEEKKEPENSSELNANSSSNASSNNSGSGCMLSLAIPVLLAIGAFLALL